MCCHVMRCHVICCPVMCCHVLSCISRAVSFVQEVVAASREFSLVIMAKAVSGVARAGKTAASGVARSVGKATASGAVRHVGKPISEEDRRKAALATALVAAANRASAAATAKRGRAGCKATYLK